MSIFPFPEGLIQLGLGGTQKRASEWASHDPPPTPCRAPWVSNSSGTQHRDNSSFCEPLPLLQLISCPFLMEVSESPQPSICRDHCIGANTNTGSREAQRPSRGF